MTNIRPSTHLREEGVIRDLLEALCDLFGDLPSVQEGVCRHCGREFDDIVSGDCPSDDCPSFKARVALLRFGVAGSDSGKKPYSVLLLYPDYANDSGIETYYAFVEAQDPLQAVAMAQQEAEVTSLDGADLDAEDFVPLLVTPGHQASEPLFEK